jgi:hypothetical protein
MLPSSLSQNLREHIAAVEATVALLERCPDEHLPSVLLRLVNAMSLQIVDLNESLESLDGELRRLALVAALPSGGDVEDLQGK